MPPSSFDTGACACQKMLYQYGLPLLALAALLVSAHPPPPSTNAERAKSTVNPRSWNLLGGGSAEAAGHERPMQEQPSFSPVVELTDTPTWEAFYKDYVRGNKPVVLRGHTARVQPAFKRWTDDYLVKNWAKMDVQAEVWKNEDREGPREEFKLKEFVKRMKQKKYENQYYAVIGFDEDAKAKADFFLPDPVRCKEVLPQSLTLWMSAGGTTSVLHHDDGENFLMLLDGTKEVMLIHQDHAQHVYAHAAKHTGTSAVHQDSVDHVTFPEFKNVNWIKATLKAGDTLYIPHSFWHQVNSQGRNLAANFWWGHKQDYVWWNPSNRSEYDVTRFGAKGAIPFDDLKRRGPEMLPCTPLAEGETMEKQKFVDEGKYKQHLTQKHKQMIKKQQQGRPVEEL